MVFDVCLFPLPLQGWRDAPLNMIREHFQPNRGLSPQPVLVLHSGPRVEAALVARVEGGRVWPCVAGTGVLDGTADQATRGLDEPGVNFGLMKMKRDGTGVQMPPGVQTPRHPFHRPKSQLTDLQGWTVESRFVLQDLA